MPPPSTRQMVSKRHPCPAAMHPHPVNPHHRHHISIPAGTSMTTTVPVPLPISGSRPSASPDARTLPIMAQLPTRTPSTTANGVPISHHSEKVKRYLSEFDSLVLSHSMNKALAMFGTDSTEADVATEDDASYLTSCPPSPTPEPNEAMDDPMDVAPALPRARHNALEHKLPTPEPSSPLLPASLAPSSLPSYSASTPVSPTCAKASITYPPQLAIGRTRAFSEPVPWATPLASPEAEVPPSFLSAFPQHAPPSPMSAPVAPSHNLPRASRKRRRSVGDADDPELTAARPSVRRRCALPDIRIPLAVLMAEAKAGQGQGQGHGPEAHL